MARVIFFSYLPVASFFHRMDGRVKLVAFLIISISTIWWNDIIVGFMLLCVALAYVKANLPITLIMQGSKVLLVLFFLFLLPGLSFHVNLSTFYTHLMSVLPLFGKLVFFFLIGIILTSTTSIATIRSALAFLLKPVPFIPHRQISIALSMTIAMLPAIFTNLQSIRDVQTVRSGKKIGTFKKIKQTASSLLIFSLKKGDSMSSAATVRGLGYRTMYALPPLKASDWGVLIAAVFISALTVWGSVCINICFNNMR